MSSVTFLGHSSVRLDLQEHSVMTDPIFKKRFLHVLRRDGGVSKEEMYGIDTVLLSHYHLDHLDLSSLRQVGAKNIIASTGSAEVIGGKAKPLLPGEEIALEGLTIKAVPALHSGSRMPWSKPDTPIGFIIDDGLRRVYFAGDTDLYPEMEEIEDIDLALMPVWGWGIYLGSGHLDPERAAEATKLIGARKAMPIHWGSYLPIGRMKSHGHLLHSPALEYEKRLRDSKTEVLLLQPGQTASF